MECKVFRPEWLYPQLAAILETKEAKGDEFYYHITTSFTIEDGMEFIVSTPGKLIFIKNVRVFFTEEVSYGDYWGYRGDFEDIAHTLRHTYRLFCTATTLTREEE